MSLFGAPDPNAAWGWRLEGHHLSLNFTLVPGRPVSVTPAFFGAKPKIIIKNGFISWAVMGDPNASLPTPQPTYYRPMFGAYGDALAANCITFVSGVAHAAGIKERLGLRRQVMPVRNVRNIGKRDMVRNAGTPKIEVSPETFAVTVDGKHATVQPLTTVSLNQKYFFS